MLVVVCVWVGMMIVMSLFGLVCPAPQTTSRYIYHNPRIETSQARPSALGSGDRDRDCLARWVFSFSLCVSPCL